MKMKKQAHVSEAKKKTVAEFTKLIKEHDIIGVVNMESLPAKQLQNMRDTLRDSVLIKMTKRNLIHIAMEKSGKKELEPLKEHLGGMPALLFTKTNPFELYSIIKKNKSKAPIKAGQKAPRDIIVPAGPTSFAPGPIIGELGQCGIAAGIEGGKVAIKKDSLAAKAGEIIDNKKAGVLLRLGIEPMEIGLDLVAVFENNEILTKSVLDIDEEAYMKNLLLAAGGALNLAYELAYPAEETIKGLLCRAFQEARSLALSQAIPADAVVPDLLMKAYAEALALNARAGGQESIKDEAKEEPAAAPKEEKKEEKKDEGAAAAGLGALFG